MKITFIKLKIRLKKSIRPRMFEQILKFHPNGWENINIWTSEKTFDKLTLWTEVNFGIIKIMNVYEIV